MKILFKNCKIINGESAPKFENKPLQDIYIVNGIIDDIGTNLEILDVQTIDLEGMIVISGMVDLECNICDPGFENVEDIKSVSYSALKGGFTSITSQPDTNPVVDNKTVVQYIVSKASTQSYVNIFPYGSMSLGCSGTEISEIGGMVQAGIIAISNGRNSIENASLLRNIMLYSKMFNLPVITHCEDKSLSGDGVMNAGYTATYLGLKGMLPDAEKIVVSRNIILAESTGAKLHIPHVSTRGSVQLIREAKARGISITADTNPQYFLLTEEAVGDFYDSLMKMNPPLRSQDDMQAVLEGIVDGTIDAISSGHSPTPFRDKDLIFDSAVYGVSGLETVFSLCYTHLVDSGLITFERFIELTAIAPAKILNLKNKGFIAKGRDADLIMVDLKSEYKIEPANFSSKAKHSPFTNEYVKGKVVHSFVGDRFFPNINTR